MWCKYCGCYIGLFSLGTFCDDCNFLRRLYLLNKEGTEREEFIKKLKIVFLKGVTLESIEKKIKIHSGPDSQSPL